MEKNGFSTQRLARLGLMTATAMILGYVESLIPFFPGVPGIKLGLSNLVTVGLLSLGAMAILRKREDFSIYGVSILGGVCHNIGQLLVAVLVVETYRLAWYLPVLLVAGMATGAAIGIVSGIMVRRLAFLWK